MNYSDNKTYCAATVGFFDGVHAGHRFLIEELKDIARAENQQALVITFSDHPRKVLHSDFQPLLITTLEEKIKQLTTCEPDEIVLLHFTPEMAKLTAQEFIKTVLYEQYQVRTLLVGHDHRFGHNRAEGFDDYQKYGQQLGMRVVQAHRFSTDEDHHISSTDIRKALQSGDITHANRLLTYHYSFQGKVVDGFKVGRKIGFPTANLKVINNEKLIPKIGVYAVMVNWNNKRYGGMMNIGLRPTLDNGNIVSLEVNIFDFDENIYHETLEVEFIEKIRDEQKFNNIDKLIEQLKKDKEIALKLLQFRS